MPRNPSHSSKPSQHRHSSVPNHSSNTFQPSPPSLFRKSGQSSKSRKPSRSSQSSHHRKYNLSRVRVWGGLTLTLSSNKATQSSRPN